MTRFENKLCPVCRTRFNEKAEIVCCPVCGVPHHRACYSINNRCALEELHASGWSWKGKLPDEERIDNAATGEAAFENTEARFEDKDDTEGSRGYMPFEEEQRMFEEQLGANNPFSELFRDFKNKEIGEDGVSMHELVAYSATSIYHYGRAFNMFRTRVNGKKRRISFNFCSGLLAPVFQFYRRMNFFGIAALIILLIPSFVIAVTPEQTLESNIDSFVYLIQFSRVILMSLLCLFGDYIYYRHCVKSIIRFRSRYDGDTKSDDYYLSLYECGKPTFAGGLVGILAVSFGMVCCNMLSGMI